MSLVCGLSGSRLSNSALVSRLTSTPGERLKFVSPTLEASTDLLLPAKPNASTDTSYVPAGTAIVYLPSLREKREILLIPDVAFIMAPRTGLPVLSVITPWMTGSAAKAEPESITDTQMHTIV